MRVQFAYVFMLFWVLGISHLTAQELPQVIPPSPTVANLMRFEEVPVDYYSGQANIAIPLFSKSIAGDLAYNLTLAYNTQGIRLDERAGWLGKGWSIFNGGIISRTIKGLPDESDHLPAGRGVYHNGFEDFGSFTPYEVAEFLWKTANGDEKYDSDYDLYQYNILGRTGRFIVEKNSQTNVLEPVILEVNSNDIITVSYNSTTYEITSFEITDPSGYIYSFNLANSNLINANTVSTGQFSNIPNVSTDLSGSNNVPNTWYMSDIKSPNGQVLCSFTYQAVEEIYETPISSVRNTIVSQVSYGDTSVENINKGMLMPKLVESSQQITTDLYYMDKVTFRDGSYVEFDLDPGNPELGCVDNNNCTNGAKLEYIKVYDSGTNLERQLKFNYHITPNDRLFLESIEDGTGSTTEDYVFTYEDKDDLPEFGSDKKDKWGYYNGDYNANSIANVDFVLHATQVNAQDITTGLLTSITMPTGGKKEFTFEPNTFSYQGNLEFDEQKIPANRIKQTRTANLTVTESITESQQVLLYIDRNQVMTFENSIVSQGNEADPDKSTVLLSKVVPKAGTNITPPSGGAINYSLYNVNDFEYPTEEFAYYFDIPTTLQYTNISAGWYVIEMKTFEPYLTQNDDGDLNVDVDIVYSTYSYSTNIMQGGGVRIAEIKFTDDNDDQKKYSYEYNELDPLNDLADVANYSSGSFEFYDDAFTYTKGKNHPFLDGYSCQGGSQFNTRTATNVQYSVTRTMNEVLTPNTKGNYVGYKYVQRKEFRNGREIHEYVSPREVQIHTLGTIQYPFKPLESKDYKRGNLVKKEVRDDDNDRKLLVEEYTYTDVFQTMASSVFSYEAKLFDCPWDQFYVTFYNYSIGTVEVPQEICESSVVEVDVSTCYGGSDFDMTLFYL